jgi:hypothetical protein
MNDPMDQVLLVLTFPLLSPSCTSPETNDPQLEDLCNRGEVALQRANIKPLDPIVLHDANWKGPLKHYAL